MHKSHLSLRLHNLKETKILRLPSDRKLEGTNGDQKTPKMQFYCIRPITYGDLSKSKILLKRDKIRRISSEQYELQKQSNRQNPRTEIQRHCELSFKIEISSRDRF